MTKYEKLQEDAREKGLKVLDLPLQYTDGICCGELIGIRSGQTEKEKTCVLAEEIAHAELTVGDILDQDDVNARKQEHLARMAAYNRLVGLSGLVRAFDHGCRDLPAMAAFLCVTDAFLADTLAAYQQQYGTCVRCEDHLVVFEPYFTVMKYL